MTGNNKTQKKSLAFLIIGFVLFFMVGIIAAFYSFNNYIYQEKQPDEGMIVEPYRGTLTGEYLCLPHKDTTGPQTMECAFGIKTDTGEYYAIDFNLMSQEHTSVPTGSRITATGLITPIENLSTDHWKKYPIEGIFSVTDSFKILD